MLASDVVNIVESSGIAELAHMYQLSRRQAEAFEIQARRVLASGHNPLLTPGGDAGSVRTHQRAAEPMEDQEPPSAEELAQTRARRIGEQPWGQRSHDIGLLRGRIATLERNVSHGYTEWRSELEVCRRTLEILEGVNA